LQAPFVLTENFQSGIPSNWILVNKDGRTPALAVQEYNQAWISKLNPDDANDTVASSTSFFDSSGKADRWLISPAITLGSFGNSIKWMAKSHDASFADDYKVLISTTGTNTVDFTDTIGLIQQEDATWIQRSVNLSLKGLNSQTIYVAFVITTFDGFKLYIDDVEVTKDDPASIDDLAKSIQLVKLSSGDYKIFADASVSDLKLFDVTGAAVGFGWNESILSVKENTAGMYFLTGMINNQAFSVKLNHTH
jgi:hypothetical protein